MCRTQGTCSSLGLEDFIVLVMGADFFPKTGGATPLLWFLTLSIPSLLQGAWALMQMLWREDNPEPVIRKKPGLLKLQKASSWRGFLGNSAPEAEQKQKAGAPGGSIDPGQGGPGPVLDSKNPPTNEAHVWRSWEHGV